MDSPESVKSGNDLASSELVTIRQFRDISEALLAKGCLDSAGIESFLAEVNISRLEWPATRGLRLQVNSEELEAARCLLEQTVAANSNV